MTTPQTTTTPTITASKSMRFDVLNRDNFTCRYCGRAAPEVRLEVDHINPISNGGKATMDNLVTACYDCNRGKSDKVLMPIGDEHKEVHLSPFSEVGQICSLMQKQTGDYLSIQVDTIKAIGDIVDIIGLDHATDVCINLFKHLKKIEKPELFLPELRYIGSSLRIRVLRARITRLPKIDLFAIYANGESSISKFGPVSGRHYAVSEDVDGENIVAWMPSPELFFLVDCEEK